MKILLMVICSLLAAVECLPDKRPSSPFLYRPPPTPPTTPPPPLYVSYGIPTPPPPPSYGTPPPHPPPTYGTPPPPPPPSYGTPPPHPPPTYGTPPPPPPPSYGTPPSPPHPSYGAHPPQTCSAGQVLHSDGRCVTLITNSYLYHVPLVSGGSSSKVKVPAPQVVRNVIFVRLPEEQNDQQSIVVSPPEHKNIVYVLKKKGQETQGPNIHVPLPKKINPEVHYVSYGEGQNPTLPSGQSLLDALSGVSQITGAVVDDGSGGNGSNNGYLPPPSPRPYYAAP